MRPFCIAQCTHVVLHTTDERKREWRWWYGKSLGRGSCTRARKKTLDPRLTLKKRFLKNPYLFIRFSFFFFFIRHVNSCIRDTNRQLLGITQSTKTTCAFKRKDNLHINVTAPLKTCIYVCIIIILMRFKIYYLFFFSLFGALASHKTVKTIS